MKRVFYNCSVTLGPAGPLTLDLVGDNTLRSDWASVGIVESAFNVRQTHPLLDPSEWARVTMEQFGLGKPFKEKSDV